MVKRSAKQLDSSGRRRWLSRLQNDVVRTADGQNNRITVLIDTNVWYSAIFYGGQPEKVVRYCLKSCELITSEYLLDELLGLFKEHKAPYKWRNTVEKSLKQNCQIVEPINLPVRSRDPKDDPIIAAALVGSCDFLVTGDEDLLSLGKIDQVHIVSGKDFMELF